MRVTTALCAARRHEFERRCKGSGVGLSQQPGESWGQPDPGSAGEGGSSPDDGEAVRHRQTVQRSLSETEGVTRVNQWLNPLKADAGSNLVDVGRIAAHAARGHRGRGLRSRRNAVGGEATRKVCGVLVAMLQGKSWAPIPSIETW